MDKREDCLKAVKATKNLRQQAEQPSNPPGFAELPDSTEATPRNVIEQSDNSGIGKLGQIHFLLPHQQLGGESPLTPPLGGHRTSGRNANQ